MEFPQEVAFLTVISGTSLSLAFGIYDAFVWKKKKQLNLHHETTPKHELKNISFQHIWLNKA